MLRMQKLGFVCFLHIDFNLLKRPLQDGGLNLSFQSLRTILLPSQCTLFRCLWKNILWLQPTPAWVTGSTPILKSVLNSTLWTLVTYVVLHWLVSFKHRYVDIMRYIPVYLGKIWNTSQIPKSVWTFVITKCLFILKNKLSIYLLPDIKQVVHGSRIIHMRMECISCYKGAS